MNEDRTVLIEDARIVFRNFAGKQGKYNREGDRSFCILLENDLAEAMFADGWNVKTLKKRDPEDLPQPYIQVAVGFRNKPPKLSLITSKGKTKLDEDTVDLFDIVDIKRADVILNPYNYEVNGRSGIKAYLKTLFVTVNEDYLELKYADVEELPTRSGRVLEAAPDWVEGEVIGEDWEPTRKAIGR